MATFEEQVESLTSLTLDGSSNPNQDELSQFLKDGVIDVTTRCLAAKPHEAEDFTRESSETTSNASLDLGGAQIISIVREDGVTSNNWRICRKISPSQQYLVTDTESLSFASKFNPVYMIGTNGAISVFPAPGSDPDAFKAYYVNNVPQNDSAAALLYSHETIKYFPANKVYLVVMYAGIKALHAKMGEGILDVSVGVPVAPASPSFTYSEPTVEDAVRPIMSIADMTSLDVSAPTYTAPVAPSFDFSGVVQALATVEIPSDVVMPTLTFDAFPTISWNFPSYPVTPSLTTVTFSSIDSAQDATGQVFSTATMSAADIYTGSAPSFVPPVMSAPDFADTNTWITTEEDPEMTNARVTEINAKIGEYSARLSESQAKWNEENILYQSAIQESLQEMQIANGVNLAQAQADLQVAIRNADKNQERLLQNAINDMQAINQNNAQLISKYQAEIGAFSSNTTAIAAQKKAEIEEWQTEWSLNLQKYTADISSAIQKYQADNTGSIQASSAQIAAFQAQIRRVVDEHSLAKGNYENLQKDALNKFNEENTEFLEDVQRKAKNLDKDIAVATQNIQQEMAKESLNMNKDIQLGLQDAVQNFQKDVQEYTASLQKYTQELTSYGTQISSGIQISTTKMKQYQMLYSQLKNEYEGIFAGMYPQQKQAAQGAA